MIPIVRLASVLVLVCASGAYGQTSSPAASTDVPGNSTQNVVTAYAVKSGKIALSSAANPKPVFLPDGTYTNESGTILVILEGVLTRLQQSTGEITEINSVRKTRQDVIVLTPSTNALMQVTDIKLPSGTFRSEDGRSSITVVAGRPTAFTIPGNPPGN